MKKSLIIIGAGGHGKVVADIAKLQGYEEVAFWTILSYLKDRV